MKKRQLLFLPKATCASTVRSAVIPRVCVCVRKKKLRPQYATYRRLFLLLDKHQALVQLPRVFCSALPGQSSHRPNLPPNNKVFYIIQFPFASDWRILTQACTGLGKRRINCSTSKWSSSKLERVAIMAFFLDQARPWPSHGLTVHCDHPLFGSSASVFVKLHLQCDHSIAIHRKCFVTHLVQCNHAIAIYQKCHALLHASCMRMPSHVNGTTKHWACTAFECISSRIAGPGELFSSDFRACARSPRWKTRCSFG